VEYDAAEVGVPAPERAASWSLPERKGEPNRAARRRSTRDSVAGAERARSTARRSVARPFRFGKTMTLRAIAGLETPTRPHRTPRARALDSAHGINVPARERRVGLLFRTTRCSAPDRRANIPLDCAACPHPRGLAASSRPTRPLRIWRISRAAIRIAVGRRTAARGVGARASVEPAALLLDEPFSALDTHLRSALERQLRETLETYQGSTLFVSHNLEEPTAYAGTR